MKFELNPKSQKVSDREMLDDLRRVADQLGQDTVTKREYLRNGLYYQGTVAKRFGSWALALEKSGLSAHHIKLLTQEDCIEDLKRVANLLHKNSVTITEYRLHGHYSERPIYRCFSSWEAALTAAGLIISPQYKERISDKEYLQNIEDIWRTLGRQPKYSEIAKPLSKYSAGAYENRFGSWRKALKSFIEYVEAEDINDSCSEEDTVNNKPRTASIGRTRKQIPKRRTSRSPSLRLRFITMRRDNFTCKLCGRSPAIEPGLILQVDHIDPWEGGGETELENLQTLCSDCNLGKSNLPMTEGEA